ncbi:class I SAM-dependent methyltransferase [Glutamicibacter sp. AOP5-A2-18]|uniref:class I SAM-dependent methyltransferase n=1 Tax=Glutamicibacter sp. AOP5-A2-18 TaxID=3457656 RepID=UPI004033A006
MSTSNYDQFAKEYARENETSLLNAYYERPAMLELAGKVQGKKILDIGCGSGPLAEQLIQRGAAVAGFDASAGMLELARERLGDSADLRVAKLGEKLHYQDNSFDDAVASLVFHYLPDWSLALQEVRRVLRHEGRLIMSVNHPILYPWNHRGQDYFKVTEYTDEVSFNGQEAELTYWHHPLHVMTAAFIDAGFVIERVWEPPYSKEAPLEIVPELLRERDAFLSFIFFSLRVRGERTY